MGSDQRPGTAFHDDDDVRPALAELVGLLPDAESFEDALRRIARLARHTVPDCDAASVSLLADGAHPVTAVATDEVAERVDGIQYALGDLEVEP